MYAVEEEMKLYQLKALRFLIGRNVLVDYYLYRESLELSLSFDNYLRTCLKADWRAWMGVISVAALKKLQLCWQQQQWSSIISLEGSRRDATM
jgi:hypothetical protein